MPAESRFYSGRGKSEPIPGVFSPPRTRGSTGVKTDEQRWVSLIVPPFDVSGYFRDMTHCVH